MFDTLWNETELHEQLSESNKRLEIENGHLRDQDKMQKEFINMAAHELRTPITPILGGIDLLEERFDRLKDEAKHELGMITRNANRLQKLAEDILQIGRIEDRSFILNMEVQVNTNSLISCAIDDRKTENYVGLVHMSCCITVYRRIILGWPLNQLQSA